jgi:Uma2 family endonuclease
MIVHLTKQPITADEFLFMPDNTGYELIGGKLVERHVGFESSNIAARIIGLLYRYFAVDAHGYLLDAEMGFQCFSDDPDRVRRADVAFIRKERIGDREKNAGWLSIAPDLAVEVLSKNDIGNEVDEKVTEYLAAGVQLVWIVHPKRREVHVYRPSGRHEILSSDAEIADEAVLPGFRCKVEEFFPPVAK